MTSNDRARLSIAERARCYLALLPSDASCAHSFSTLYAEVEAMIAARLADLEAQLAAARSALAAVREVREANR